MRNFYLIKKLNKVISSKSNREIVTRMRIFDWNNHSNNSDYMHVYAFWRSKKSDTNIRYENENVFVEDLIQLKQIVKLSFWEYFLMNVFGVRRKFA